MHALDQLAKHLHLADETLRIELEAHPDFARMMEIITGALADHPEAASSVAEALRGAKDEL